MHRSGILTWLRCIAGLLHTAVSLQGVPCIMCVVLKGGNAAPCRLLGGGNGGACSRLAGYLWRMRYVGMSELLLTEL